ncbi:MAG: hypothetical protein H6730_21525 [Deltaproteobacteria bacterium]|nr:hypothetical protein [Deltaproteobacteria bacterium]
MYSETVKGRWRGRAYYFGNFEDGSSVLGGQSPLDRWRANRGDPSTLNDVPNAFIQAWGRFRNNQFSAAEMEALVQATTTGSWQFDRVQQLCEEAGFGRSAVCAPFGGAGSAAVIPYTSAGNINRVPSGVVQMDMVLNLEPATFEEEADPGLCGRRGLTPGSGEHCFVGRIDSAQALQYGGNPAVVLRFEDDPLDCQTMGSAGCVSYLADAYSEVRVGARYVPEEDDTTCALVPGLEVRTVPWLVPGFDPPGNGGGREVRECRDQRVPFDGAPELNVSFAGANPIPDGKSRLRRIELVDGIMLNQSTMQLILRETVDAFHGGATPFVSYAYVTLTKDDADLELGDYQGNRPKDDRSRDNQLLGVSCGSDLINQVTRRPNRTVETLSVADRDRLAYAVVTGATSGDAITVSNPALESIHYVCIWNEDTVVPDDNGIDQPFSQVREVFDGGPGGTTLCPGGAQIVYFALDARDFVDANGAAIDPATLDCNQNSNGSPESCLSQLRAWVDGASGSG